MKMNILDNSSDVLLVIFNFLSDGDILNITSVCKQFNQIGESLRKESLYQLWNKKPVITWDIPRDIVGGRFKDLSGNLSSEQFEIALEYLINQKVDLRRGDLIRFLYLYGYRNDGIAIYNGKEIINLEFEFDEYGYLPKEFRVIEEFPIKYFHFNGVNEDGYVTISHNTIVWFDYKPYLTEILENVIIGKIPNSNMLEESIYTYFTYKNGRKYYIVASGEDYFHYDTKSKRHKLKSNALDCFTTILQDDFEASDNIGIIMSSIMSSIPNLDILYLESFDKSADEQEF